MNILAKAVAYDASIETSQSLVTCNYAEGAVLHLLQYVVLAVGLVYLSHAILLVNARGIDVGTEHLVGEGKDIRLAYL